MAEVQHSALTGDDLHEPKAHTHAPEDWETVMASISGKVHRWAFEEASGYPQDQIGSLHMTSGTIGEWQQPSPVGSAMRIDTEISGSGQGNAPIGNATRSVVAVWKAATPGVSSAVDVVDWGPTGATRQWCHFCANHDDGFYEMCSLFWSDDHKIGHVITDGEWHMLAWRYSARAVSMWADGSKLSATRTIGDLATGAGTLTIGSGHNTYHADLTIFSRWVTDYELDRLWKAFVAGLEAM